MPLASVSNGLSKGSTVLTGSQGRNGRTLVLGYGNPARGDDGLGPALVARVNQAGLSCVETRVDYQLCVEEALDLGNFREVVFVDASKSACKPYEFLPLIYDAPPPALNTHSLSPEALMYLARTLFGAITPAYLLAIRGYEFEPFAESISRKAQKNLGLAFDYLVRRLQAGESIDRSSG